jgi:hypothetical protein
MRVVEAIIREVVESYAIVILDDNGNIEEVEDVVDEEGRYDLELVEIIKDIDQEGTVGDPREVE